MLVLSFSGALNKKTKEMPGLVVRASADLALPRLRKILSWEITISHYERPSVFEVFAAATIVGGTIGILQGGRAVHYWEN